MDKLKIDQARDMLHLQAAMNATVNVRWIEAGYPFLRAVVVEVGEALEHLGWKWWKKQDPDIEQVRLELIDILHFYLSAILVSEKGDEDSAAQFLMENSVSRDTVVLDGQCYVLGSKNLLELLELLAGLSAARRIEVCVLEECFKRCDLDWNTATKIYVSKNVLNVFRQAHGYKEGTYIKIWNGDEDNVVLSRIADTLSPNSVDYAAALYSALEERYRDVIAGK